MLLRRSWLVGLSIAVFLILGARLAVAQDAPQVPPPAAPAAEKPAAEADPFAVPEGDPAKLLQFIQDLGKQRPEGRDMQSVITFIGKVNAARLAAADKILAAADATAEQKTIAARVKLQSLMQTMQLPLPQEAKDKASEALKAMPAQLTALGLADLARAAEGAVLQNELRAAADGAAGARPLNEVIEAIKAFVAQKADPGSFGVASGAVMLLDQMDKKTEAAALCDHFVELFSKNPDEKAAKLAKTLAGIGRRLRLLGNTMEITGKTVDGQSFDWAKYRGKVVLVQFWASWCGPCKAELPNVEKYYQAYHDRGFDVVGISLDRTTEDLKKFLEEKKLPWTIIYNGDNPDPNADKFPNATYYGITGIPALFLVDKEGKVVSLNARGPALGEELAKLLGPLPATDAKPAAEDSEKK